MSSPAARRTPSAKAVNATAATVLLDASAPDLPLDEDARARWIDEGDDYDAALFLDGLPAADDPPAPVTSVERMADLLGILLDEAPVRGKGRRSRRHEPPRPRRPSSSLRAELDSRGVARPGQQVRPDPLRRGRADLLFHTERLAVYVDGCFWRGSPGTRHASVEAAAYWVEAAVQARARDAQTDLDLRAAE